MHTLFDFTHPKLNNVHKCWLLNLGCVELTMSVKSNALFDVGAVPFTCRCDVNRSCLMDPIYGRNELYTGHRHRSAAARGGGTDRRRCGNAASRRMGNIAMLINSSPRPLLLLFWYLFNTVPKLINARFILYCMSGRYYARDESGCTIAAVSLRHVSP